MAGDKKVWENFNYQKTIVIYRKKLLKIAILKVVKMNQIFQFILVQVHPKSELSSVQVHLAKKWTKFSSSSPKKWTFELNWTFPFSSSTSLSGTQRNKSFAD